MFGEAIITEIDNTLDRLICNAEAIQKVDFKELTETEIDAFEKTQESLLQHLLFMDQRLVDKNKQLDKRSANFKIQEKLLQFEKMKTNYSKNLSEVQSKTAILSKRRSKRFIGLSRR